MRGRHNRGRSAYFRFLVFSSLALFVGAIMITFAAMLTYLDLPTFSAAVLSAEVRFAIRLTLITTTITTAICVLFGVPAAYVLSRYRLPFAALIDTVLDLPLVLPPLVGGIALLIFFQTPIGRWIETHIIPLVYTTQGVVLGQLVTASSFCLRTMRSAFDSIDPRMEQVARTLGCTERQAFTRVLLPLARNGLLAGTIMTWTRAAGEFGPILFFAGATRFKTEVLPIAVFLNMTIGKVEMALAVTIILVLLALITLLLFRKLGGRFVW